MRIFLFIVDSLRHDYVGVYNPKTTATPQIDKIAEGGVIFENAFSQSNWTYPSLYSLFTGVYPSRLELTFFNQKILASDRMLPEILTKQGYHTAVFSSFKTLVHPKTFGSHFEERRLISLSKDALIEFKNWLRENKKRENFFLFFHLGDFTHVPYCVPKSFLKKELSEKLSQNPIIQALTTKHSDDFSEIKIKEIFRKINARLLRLNPEEIQHLKDCYEGGIRFIDEFIGKCFNILSEELNDFFFIISADHGECFLEHGIIGHGVGLYNELIKIPLVIFNPKKKPRKVTSAVQLLDLYLTIFDLAQIDYPKIEMDSVSLFERDKKQNKPVLSDAYPLISLIDGHHKLISSYLKFKTKKELSLEIIEILRAKKIGRLVYRLQSLLKRDELYDLRKDLEETQNLRNKERKKYRLMKQKIKEYVTHSKDIKLNHQDFDIEDELKTQLEGLGYL